MAFSHPEQDPHPSDEGLILVGGRAAHGFTSCEYASIPGPACRPNLRLSPSKLVESLENQLELQYQDKTPTFAGEGFILVAGAGLEPATFWL